MAQRAEQSGARGLQAELPFARAMRAEDLRRVDVGDHSLGRISFLAASTALVRRLYRPSSRIRQSSSASLPALTTSKNSDLPASQMIVTPHAGGSTCLSAPMMVIG